MFVDDLFYVLDEGGDDRPRQPDIPVWLPLLS